MSNTLQLQLDIADYLGAHAAFQYVPIICEYRDEVAGDALLNDIVLKSLKGSLPKNGKFGLCVVISSPDSETTAVNSPGPVENFIIEVQIVENTANNKAPSTGTGIRADDMYELVKRMLHLHSPDGEHGLIVVKGQLDEGLPTPLHGFVIHIESKAHALQPLTKVNVPQISIADPNMTLSTPTAGAAIYWTQDGSCPSPANATAALYAAPVDVHDLPSGTVIRAAAYLEPLRGSDCRARTL